METSTHRNPLHIHAFWVIALITVLAGLLLVSPVGADLTAPSDSDELTTILGLSDDDLDEGHVAFAGVITAIPGGELISDWIIGGETVHVTTDTVINQENADAVEGNWAAVLAVREDDDTYTALRVYILPPVFVLKGPINGIPPGSIGEWIIAGQTISVTEDTQIGDRVGPTVPGAWVIVFAKQDGDELVAQRLIVIPPQNQIMLHGAIQQVGTDLWVVSGIPVAVDGYTIIHGPEQVGLLAMVKAEQLDDLSLLARHISVDWREREDPDEPHRIVFQGEVEEMPAGGGLLGDWLVAGRTVHVTDSTDVDESKGPAEVGARVLIKGILQVDESVLATHVVVLPPIEQHVIRFEGTIEALPTDGLIGVWTISGREVEVNERTWIDEHKGEAVVGAEVAVVALVKNDGALLALRIQVKGEDDEEHFVRFKGPIVRLPDDLDYLGIWIVGGQQVEVTAETEIDTEHGEIALGVWVEVMGVHQISTDSARRLVLAHEIEVLERPHPRRTPEPTGTPEPEETDDPDGRLEVEFEGQIESRPSTRNGLWRIVGHDVEVTEATKIKEKDGPAVVGAYVKVEGWQALGGGPVMAKKIEVKDGD